MPINRRTVVANPLSLAFIALSLAIIYLASQFPDRGEIGAHFFPTLIAIGIIAFSIADMMSDEVTEQDFGDYDLKAAAVVSVLLLGYVILMPVTGFLVGTMIFLPIAMYYSDVRSKILIALISIVLPIVLFYVFSQIFFVRLPEGLIPFSRLLPPLPLEVVIP